MNKEQIKLFLFVPCVNSKNKASHGTFLNTPKEGYLLLLFFHPKT